MKLFRYTVLVVATLFFQLVAGTSGAHQISVKETPGKLRFSAIEKDSIYEKAGFQKNDVVRAINGKPVTDNTPIEEVEKVVLTGGKIKIERKGKIIELNLKPTSQDVLIDPDANR